MRLVSFVSAAICLLASPGLAESEAMRMIFAPDAPCWGRSYDSAHLAAHPDQQVTNIVVFSDTEDMELDATDDWLVLVEVLTRSGTAPYSGIGVCIDGNRGLFCLMEGDAGGFFLSDLDGRLQLQVMEQGMSFEGVKDFITLEHDRGDDRLFLMDEGMCG